jgi:hypothetical protein
MDTQARISWGICDVLGIKGRDARAVLRRTKGLKHTRRESWMFPKAEAANFRVTLKEKKRLRRIANCVSIEPARRPLFSGAMSYSGYGHRS